MTPRNPSRDPTDRQPEVRTDFFVGLDLGQARDYTAVAVLERTRTFGPKELQRGQWERPEIKADRRYTLRFLERPALGTPYPAIAERVGVILSSPALSNRSHLVVDATGVGRPVVDLLRGAGLSPFAVTITGGTAVGWGDGEASVPKRDLVLTLQVLFQSERLKVADGLDLASVFIKELLEFKVKISISGHDSYEALREGTHDDLVLAVAMAAWWGERKPEPLRRVQGRVWSNGW